ncbi:hypothetical protein DTL21_17910 [Bremerella cremea]|uniref:Ferrichrome ABC transporter permease n=1 Tax=Blastopirellula marina TaxID=124 RepID=A0A2S8FIY0_9BACT|nr:MULTISPECIES: fused MFS/spermidine synthase [Pirellulaceae]PQO32111.1 hypothetical protein C5Y83_17895 [Blastopirellula marina]RCS45177.1 hypothetical protein DTL21_17910 [Bremerella cremea]
MSNSNQKLVVGWILPLAVLWSAFLLFQVQPLISKTILPWFGGSPTVWTTCMLFFQVVLFTGYLYAHLLATYCPRKWQAVVHAALMVLALFLMPISPGEAWKPGADVWPPGYILALLATHLGLPYFLLSANGPLLQHWFSELAPGKVPYRLYALSNVGSLVALLTYPFLVEPNWTLPWQAEAWGWGYVGFAMLLLPIALAVLKNVRSDILPEGDSLASPIDTEAAVPDTRTLAAWLVLPAFACIMLLATTNHVCQDMAVVPFLWVVPLSLYLLTFIFCFDGDGWYRRGWIGPMALGSIVVISLLQIFGGMVEIAWVAVSYFGAMFFVCMICHGELVRLKPAPRHLTLYYLMISGGGALGGMFVSLVCPLIFSQYYEMPLSLIVAFGLAMWVTINATEKRFGSIPMWSMGLLFLGLLATLSGQLRSFHSSYLESQRNFYGVLSIGEVANAANEPILAMYHGQIMHGFQYQQPDKRQTPTSYYAANTGIGLTMSRLDRPEGRRIGVVGLGAGTLAAYGEKGDTFRFYEINDDVLEMAQQHFTFLQDTPADVELELGDARLSLERESEQKFDVLVLDAFSGDAIPTHLLTREAFAIYMRHLAEGGVLAIHVSNKHLDLRPVVLGTCQEFDLETLYITTAPDSATQQTGSQWIITSQNQQFLSDDTLQSAATNLGPKMVYAKPWTDNFSNLLEVLK